MFKENIQVAKIYPSFEALIVLAAKMAGLVIVYLIFEVVGKWLIGDDFNTETLLSLVILPTIYVLKDSYTILEPYFVKINLCQESVTVETGILTKNLDCLNLKTVENIEIITSPLGRLGKYSTLHVFSYGSWVELPHVKSAVAVKERIESGLKK